MAHHIMLCLIEIGSYMWYNVSAVRFFDTGGMTMARPKKNGTYLNVCIETPIYERLELMCAESGQTKTVAVERALAAYLDAYEKEQEMLKQIRKEIRE